MIIERHGGIKVYIYMNNLMADCSIEESVKMLCFHFFVYTLRINIYLPAYHFRKWNVKIIHFQVL